MFNCDNIKGDTNITDDTSGSTLGYREWKLVATIYIDIVNTGVTWFKQNIILFFGGLQDEKE